MCYFSKIVLNQLAYVMGTKLYVFNLTLHNKIFRNLNCTFIVTIDNSQGLNMKTKLTQYLSKPNYLYTSIDYSMLFGFCSRKRDYLLFLSLQNQWSKSQTKKIAKSGVLSSMFLSYPELVKPTDEYELQ